MMLRKAWGHFSTITKHKLLVMKYCFRIGLYKQGLLHDLSKYSPTEFLAGCRYYQWGHRSPNNQEREETGMSKAWLHHKGRNKHHFEYWIDYGIAPCPTTITGMEMPKRYVAEMIMDRICASKVYGGKAYTDAAPLAYYMNSRDKMWFIHENTKKQMEQLLNMLAEKGEQETLFYIKNVFLKEK